MSILGKIIAMYMRLSVADDDFEEDESNSIKAQRDLMYQYISEKEEFKDYEIEEFCDDGSPGQTSIDLASGVCLNLLKAV